MGRRYGDTGLVMPSGVALASLVVVTVAVLAFLVTGSPDPVSTPPPAAASAGEPEPDPDPDPTKDTAAPPAPPDKAKGQPREREPRRPPATKSPSPQAYVEVYNNSSITGLAAQTASELQDAGWNVVGTDNWYGEVPATTVYYPQRLRDQARLLARELGVDRVLPAVTPMRFDRLTVILTAVT